MTRIITRHRWNVLKSLEKWADDHSSEIDYLWLNPNFNEAANDGEHVANDEQNIPAIDELHSVSPGYTAAKFAFEKLHILLFGEEEIAT